MSPSKYFNGVVLFLIAGGTALATHRFGLENWGILRNGIYSGSGVVGIIGLGLIVQSFIPEE